MVFSTVSVVAYPNSQISDVAEKLVRDKHSSLLCSTISGDQKMFYNIDSRLQVSALGAAPAAAPAAALAALVVLAVAQKVKMVMEAMPTRTEDEGTEEDWTLGTRERVTVTTGTNIITLFGDVM
jgi:hypothetical protein